MQHTTKRAGEKAREFFKPLLAMLAMVLVAVIVDRLFGHSAGVLMASVFVPVQARTPDELQAIASPGNATLSATREPLYDTQTYVSGTTLSLTYFQAINVDRSMSNMKGNGGAMPNNMYFEPLWINFDVLAGPTVSGDVSAAGILDDIAQLVLKGRGYARITIGQTTYPEIPLSYLHGSGGPFGATSGSITAPSTFQSGTNGVQDSGYCVYGSYVLTPMLPFAVTVNWPSPVTLKSAAPVNLRFSFDGNWYLPVS